MTPGRANAQAGATGDGELIAPKGAYGAYAAPIWAEAPDQEILGVGYKPLMVAAAPVQVLVTAISPACSPGWRRVMLEPSARATVSSPRRAGSLQGQLPAVGVCASLLLVLLEGDYIYVADGLLLSWVLAEVAGPA